MGIEVSRPMACRSIRPVKSCYAYPNTSAYARICSCESRALRPGMNSRRMAIQAPSAANAPVGTFSRARQSRRCTASRSSVPHHRMSSVSCNGDRRSTAASSARMSDARRAAGNRQPVRASSSGSEIWKTRKSSRGQIVGPPTHRARPAVFLSDESMCAGPQRKWRALRSDAHCCGSQPSCFTWAAACRWAAGMPGPLAGL
jgi:hypothetical protein